MLQMNISLPFMRVMGKRSKMDSIWLRGIYSKRESFAYPKDPSGKLIVKESHEGGLMGHFGIDKTLVLLKEKFYWPHMKKYVHKHCIRCVACLQAKSRVMPHGLYTPLRIPFAP